MTIWGSSGNPHRHPFGRRRLVRAVRRVAGLHCHSFFPREPHFWMSRGDPRRRRGPPRIAPGHPKMRFAREKRVAIQSRNTPHGADQSSSAEWVLGDDILYYILYYSCDFMLVVFCIAVQNVFQMEILAHKMHLVNSHRQKRKTIVLS